LYENIYIGHVSESKALVDDYLEVYQGLCDAKKVSKHTCSSVIIYYAPNCPFLIHSLLSS